MQWDKNGNQKGRRTDWRVTRKKKLIFQVMEANAHLGRLILELNAKVREIDGYFLSPRVSSLFLSLSPLYSSLTSRIEDGGESKAKKNTNRERLKKAFLIYYWVH